MSLVTTDLGALAPPPWTSEGREYAEVCGSAPAEYSDELQASWPSSPASLVPRGPQIRLSLSGHCTWQDVIEQLGCALGRRHAQAARIDSPTSDLRTHVEAVRHWRMVASDTAMARFLPIDPARALTLVDLLGERLWRSTPERLLCEFDMGPCRLEPSSTGELVFSTRPCSVGYHAWFEMLAHLHHPIKDTSPSRATLSSLAQVLEGYQSCRTEVDAQAQSGWWLNLLRCRTLLDLSRIGQLLTQVYPLSSSPTLTETLQVHSPSYFSLHTVVGRLQEDLAALESHQDFYPALRIGDIC